MADTTRKLRYAPKGGKYLTLALPDGAPRARRLVVTAPLTATDGGDRGDLGLDIAAATGSARGVMKLAGQLGGTADAPDVRGVRALDGGSPQLLAIGEVQDGEVLARSGSSVVGVAVVPASGGTMSGDLAMGGHKVTGLATGSAPGDAATYGQVTSLLNGLDWQASVLDARATPPGGPTAGDRYLVVATATGAWTGLEKKIAQWNGSAWDFTTPNKGFTVHVEALGQDLVYNGSYPTGSWVNIGASVDHASLLNLTTGDPHAQYQLASQREAANGYAGLGSDSLPLRPAKAVRAGGDPGSPAPGEVWVVGSELKFRNDTGSPATEFIERQARRNQANGYAGLESGGRVAAAQAPPKGVYATGGDQALSPVDIGAEAFGNKNQNNGYAGLDGGGRVAAAQAPAKATYATGGGQALSPADIGAPPTGRHVDTGTGLAGGGDLTNDRTLSIAAFTGLIAKDIDPASQGYPSGVTQIAEWDAGANGCIQPVLLRLPATTSASLKTELAVVYHDGTPDSIFQNTNTGADLDQDFVQIASVLMGNLNGNGSNNGRLIRKIRVQVNNTSGGTVTADIGAFRLRAFGMAKGGGAAP